MIYELIVFGGIMFWGLFAAISLLLLSLDEEWPRFIVFIVSAAAFFAFTNPPEINIWYIASYFGVGLLYFSIVFNYKLTKIKKLITYFKDNFNEFNQLNADSIIECMNSFRSEIKYSDEQKEKKRLLTKMYEQEPSFEKFFVRIFCWPFCLLELMLKDLTEEIYRRVTDALVNYKKNFLDS